MSETLTNAMTVDVEDYFQVSAFEKNVARDEWDSRECRVERNLDRIFELFDRHGVKATFFTLGWIAERYPHLIRRMAELGHEVASHGWSHVRVTQQTREDFSADVIKTKRVLEDLAGTAVLGYRAASYSITKDNLWALEVLEQTGHLYSSSIFPIKHDLYGIPDAPRFAYAPNGSDFKEYPVTTVRLGERNLPCGGGGWFRLVPYAGMRWAMRRVNRKDHESVIFYFHPWEIDPDQPRVEGVSAKSRFRHYLNLDRMESRLDRLLGDFNWSTMRDTFHVVPASGKRATR